MGDEKSVAVKIGWSLKGGFSAKFDSRATAALDALGGDLIWQLNNDRARTNSREKALREAEAELIAAATKSVSSYLKKEPEIALALLKGGICDFVNGQVNQAVVGRYTLEALEASPPTDAQANAGSDKLSPEFTNRFRRYAAEASSEEVRRRWASVLAQELRVPGTFNSKVLRVIDETDRETAEEFLDLCTKHSVLGCLPVLTTQLSDEAVVHLDSHGLLLPRPDFKNFVRTFDLQSDDLGKNTYLIGTQDTYTLGIDVESSSLAKEAAYGMIYLSDLRRPMFQVDYFTDEGSAICSTIRKTEPDSIRNLAVKLAEGLSAGSIDIYERTNNTWMRIEQLPAPGQ